METKFENKNLVIKNAFEILILVFFAIIGVRIIKKGTVIVQGSVWIEGGPAVIFGVFVVAHMILALARMLQKFLSRKKIYLPKFWRHFILFGQVLTFIALSIIFIMN